MRVVHHEEALPPRIPQDANVKVHLLYVVIDDINDCANTLITKVSDTSWISRLPDIPKASLSANAERTANNLVKIFQGVDSQIKKEFGEFMISMTSGSSLESHLDHIVLPLSELWKPKSSGNEGFDFHTETPDERINFGEAK